MDIRSSGVLMHITSLPGPYGIGTFGEPAYKFVDFLQLAGQRYWQILPLGPTGFGDSPYQSFSTFAGNPYLIDFNLLLQEGLLNKEDFQNINFGDTINRVDFKKIFENKFIILKKAYRKGKEIYYNEIEEFKNNNKDWIEDYALFMALKFENQLKPWKMWDKDLRLRKAETIKECTIKLAEEINYWIFIQYIFFKQWKNLKSYANNQGIQIIGDIPIYVAEDSADTWANSEIFLLDNENLPIKVAGVPPDYFSKTGQLWGNPIYRWDVLEDKNFDWWIKRLKASQELYDLIRIDHFRGFESFWEIPYGDQTAENGRWSKGPGIRFFNTIEKTFKELKIIAEDLGILTSDVISLRKDTGYPGMKVLQFAFDIMGESDYLPHNYKNNNSVIYTGTHDNNTAMGWFNNWNAEEVKFAINYLKLTKEEGYHWGFIRGAWASIGNIAIAQMQDFLGLGSETRMNVPSTTEGNWQWRIDGKELTNELAEKILKITRLYGR